MVPLSSLWMPILLSAVLVFIVSSIIHMVLGYHRNDYEQLPQQDQIMDALRPFSIPPGNYVAPRAPTMAEMRSPEFIEKMKRGPVFSMIVHPAGEWAMGRRLAQWFIFSVVVSLFAAYVASRTLPPGTDYMQVMRIVGTVAFIGYALGQIPDSIWYNKKWSTTLKSAVDALVYGLVTGGAFGWLWPAM